MKKSEIKEYLDKNYLQATIIFEVVGNPKEHVQKTLDLLSEKIQNEKDLKIIKLLKEEPEEAGEGLWGSFIEADMLIKDMYKLSYIAFNYMPASIEIIEPATKTLKDKDLTMLFSDLLAGLHENNARNVQISNKNIGLQKTINALIKNASLMAASEFKKPKDIAKPLGLKEKDVIPFLDLMVKEKTMVKEEGMYRKV
jgi:hypothetical protein